MKNIWVVYYFPVVCGVFFLCLNLSQAQLSLPPPTVETGDAINITSSSATLTGYGNEKSFLTLAGTPTATPTPTPMTLPVETRDVITDDATEVTSNSARLHGRILNYVTIGAKQFEYGIVSGALDHTVEAFNGAVFGHSSEPYSSGQIGTYYRVNATIRGLSPATTYYYRIVGQYKNRNTYGDEKSFTTLLETETPVPTPTVAPTPQTPTVITGRGGRFFDENTVVFYGTVNPNGLLTTVWAKYGTNSSAYDHTSTTQSFNGTATQRVRFDISGLPYRFGSGYYYYYRIAAQNSAGISYGSEKEDALKMTRFSSGTSITDDATNITPNSAILSGRCYAISPSRWFEYDTISGEYFYEVEAYSCAPDGYCAGISGLSPATTYFYRMAGEDKDIVYYGETKSFVTLNATPTPPPECNPVSITVSPKRLILQRGQGSEVTVTLQGNNCIPEGKTITATIGKAGGRRISISSAREVTDANGQAGFTITAKDKIGNAKVTFNADSLKKALTVLVRQ